MAVPPAAGRSSSRRRGTRRETGIGAREWRSPGARRVEQRVRQEDVLDAHVPQPVDVLVRAEGGLIEELVVQGVGLPVPAPAMA